MLDHKKLCHKIELSFSIKVPLISPIPPSSLALVARLIAYWRAKLRVVGPVTGQGRQQCCPPWGMLSRSYCLQILAHVKGPSRGKCYP